MIPNDHVTTISIVNTGILSPRQSSEAITISADAGTCDYNCASHQYMRGQQMIKS